MNELTETLNALPLARLALGAAGVVLLLFGRRVLWLAVAALGFLAGMSFAIRVLEGAPGPLVIGVGFACGIVAAGLAFFVQRLAIAFGAFVVGGWIARWAIEATDRSAGLSDWLVFALGGVLAVILALAFFEWSIALVTACAGALLLLQATAFAHTIEVPAFILLASIGVLVQMSGRGKREREREE
ncbi:MAG TPA: hypothetical protein VF017_02400 [Thermoanaerobaculia bacterium]|nr:hypothetical protein [Thermoanaerobaculia bacterium]